MKNFWFKFAKSEEITQNEIAEFEWINRVIFEAFLLRKKYTKKVKWTSEFINKMATISTVPVGHRNARYILKLCMNQLQKMYKKNQFEYEKKHEHFLQNFSFNERKTIGFLHYFFNETAERLKLPIKDFEFVESKLKRKDKLKNYLILIYQSEKFKNAIENLIGAESIFQKNGFWEDIENNIRQKICIKINSFSDLTQKYELSNRLNEFLWAKEIWENILLNPKTKFFFTYEDVKNCIYQFNNLVKNI